MQCSEENLSHLLHLYVFNVCKHDIQCMYGLALLCVIYHKPAGPNTDIALVNIDTEQSQHLLTLCQVKFH